MVFRGAEDGGRRRLGGREHPVHRHLREVLIPPDGIALRRPLPRLGAFELRAHRGVQIRLLGDTLAQIVFERAHQSVAGGEKLWSGGQGRVSATGVLEHAAPVATITGSRGAFPSWVTTPAASVLALASLVAAFAS